MLAQRLCGGIDGGANQSVGRVSRAKRAVTRHFLGVRLPEKDHFPADRTIMMSHVVTFVTHPILQIGWATQRRCVFQISIFIRHCGFEKTNRLYS